MQVFYAPDISRDSSLPPEESFHAIKVLRLRRGESLFVLDGKGNLYECRLLTEDKENAMIETMHVQREYEKRNYSLHLAIAPTKNPDRFEFFVEKAVEIGVDRITPITCEHSEKTRLKTERLERIIISAMKQSYNAWKPVLDPLTTFEEALILAKGSCGIAHCEDSEKLPVNQFVSGKKEISLFLGPEGDFSHREITQALEMNFKAISLGRARLRTETAGIAACYAVHMVLGI